MNKAPAYAVNIRRVPNGWVVYNISNEIIAVFNDDASLANYIKQETDNTYQNGVVVHRQMLEYDNEKFKDVIHNISKGRSIDAIKDIRHVFKIPSNTDQGSATLSLKAAKDIHDNIKRMLEY